MPAPTQELSNDNVTRILNLHQAVCAQAKGLKRLSKRNRLLHAKLDLAEDLIKMYEKKHGTLNLAEFPDSLTNKTLNKILEDAFAGT